MAILGHTGYLFKDRYLNFDDKGKSSVAFTLGRGSYIVQANYENATVRNHILIGKYTSIAHEINFIIAINHNYKAVTTYHFIAPDMMKQVDERYKEKFANAKFPVKNPLKTSHQIIIGNDVWIGARSTIMGGVKIGNGAVIGANSVVAKDIPPYAIAVGNPARVIKYRFDEETIKKFMAVKWWNWDINKIYDNVPIMGDIEKFLDKHYNEGLEYIAPTKLGGGISIEQFRAEGRKIFSFVADFRVLYPLWKRVLSGFLKSNLRNAVMLFFLTNEITADDYQEIMKLVETPCFNDGKIIQFIQPAEGKIFEPYLLRKSTHFITTREMINVECLDFLYDTDVKIISALDDNIFENEPAVNWKEIYS